MSALDQFREQLASRQRVDVAETTKERARWLDNLELVVEMERAIEILWPVVEGTKFEPKGVVTLSELAELVVACAMDAIAGREMRQ